MPNVSVLFLYVERGAEGVQERLTLYETCTRAMKQRLVSTRMRSGTLEHCCTTEYTPASRCPHRSSAGSTNRSID